MRRVHFELGCAGAEIGGGGSGLPHDDAYTRTSLTHLDHLYDTDSSSGSQASSAAVSGSLQAPGATMDILSNQV